MAEARLKGRENCGERKGRGTRAFVSFPSVGLSRGGGSRACGSLLCLLFRVAGDVQLSFGFSADRENTRRQ